MTMTEALAEWRLKAEADRGIDPRHPRFYPPEQMLALLAVVEAVATPIVTSDSPIRSDADLHPAFQEAIHASMMKHVRVQEALSALAQALGCKEVPRG